VLNKRIVMGQIEPIITEDFLLLEKIKSDSKIAFNRLFEKYWGKAYSEAYKRLKNEEDAKDIVQEIFTKIWLNRQTQTIENFPAYLHVSIRNNVIKLLSRHKPIHPFFDILENIPQKNSEADSALLWNEFLKSYEALLQKMPPKRQQIFRLKYHGDLTTKDISLQLGITRKTVQNQLGKAIEFLKVALNIISVVGMILIIKTHFI
jgi:RNA polymerase sigma-70 factor (ECF subfamily)